MKGAFIMPSVMQRVGTPNARHNLDNTYRKNLDHVDSSLSQYNEVVQHRTVEQIYAEKLQPAFEEFNERQKRKDRRLDVKWNCSDALGYQRAMDKAAQASDNKIDKKGRPPIREIVTQFGNPEQGFGCAGQTEASREFIFGLLKETQAEFQKRYPQFDWGDVVIHADEVSADAEGKLMGSIHMHSGFVPLCYENKRGMEVQVAFERCLKEMGFTSFEAWKHDLDSVMEEVLARHGLERTYMENHEEHQPSTQFHRQQEAIRETKELEGKRDEAREELTALETQISDTRAEFTAAKAEADRQEERVAVVSEAHKEKVQELKDVTRQVSYRKRDVDELERQRDSLATDVNTLTGQKEKAKQEVTDLAKQRDAEFLAAKNAYGEAVEASQRLRRLQEDIDAATKEKKALQGEITALEGKVADLKDQSEKILASGEVEDISGEHGVMYTKLPTWQFNALKRTAAQVDEAIPRAEKAEKLADEVTQENKQLRSLLVDRDTRMGVLERVIQAAKAFVTEFVPQLLQKFQIRLREAELGQWVSVEPKEQERIKTRNDAFVNRQMTMDAYKKDIEAVKKTEPQKTTPTKSRGKNKNGPEL